MKIDVHWNLNKVFEVLLGLFGDTLRALEVDCPSDPWSLLWRNKPPKCKFMDYT